MSMTQTETCWCGNPTAGHRGTHRQHLVEPHESEVGAGVEHPGHMGQRCHEFEAAEAQGGDRGDQIVDAVFDRHGLSDDEGSGEQPAAEPAPEPEPAESPTEEPDESKRYRTPVETPERSGGRPPAETPERGGSGRPGVSVSAEVDGEQVAAWTTSADGEHRSLEDWPGPVVGAEPEGGYRIDLDLETKIATVNGELAAVFATPGGLQIRWRGPELLTQELLTQEPAAEPAVSWRFADALAAFVGAGLVDVKLHPSEIATLIRGLADLSGDGRIAELGAALEEAL